MTERPRIHRWTPAEDAILRERYPVGGTNGVRDILPDLSEWTIRYRVGVLGLRIDKQNFIRRPAGPKGYDESTKDIAFWFASALLSTRPSVPSLDCIINRWNVTKATAYRWRRWALDRQQQLQAREPEHGHVNQ